MAASPSATHILFDIDGTLADSAELGFSATQEVLAKEGLASITHEDYHAHTIYPTPERLARHSFGLPRPTGTISDGAAEALSLGLVATREEFLSRGARLGGAFDELYIGLVSVETARFYDGILPMLQRLRGKGVPVGALTNAAVAYAEAVLVANGARPLFDSVHGADDVPRPKPHPDGLMVCVADLGNPPPAQCVYVGDSPSDGAAAAAAGMRSVGVSYGSHSLAAITGQFDEIVHSPAELEAALLRLLGSAGEGRGGEGGAEGAGEGAERVPERAEGAEGAGADPVNDAAAPFGGLSCGAFKMQQLQGGEQQQRIAAFLASEQSGEGGGGV